MKLGVFTVSMPQWEPDEAMVRLSEMGYDGIEWRVTDDDGDRSNPGFWSGNRCGMTVEQVIERAETLKARAAELSLAMPSLGTYVNCTDLDAVEKNMRAAVAVGAGSLRIGSPRYNPEVSYASQFDSFRAQYAQVAELAGRYGVRALIETHMGQLAPSVAKARAVLEGLDPACVGIMWDLGNQVIEGGEVPQMAFDIAGEYLGEVHVKNVRFAVKDQSDAQTTWKPDWCPIEKGIVDWPAAIALLKKGGYDGWLMIEDFSGERPLDERLRRNLTWFRELIG